MQERVLCQTLQVNLLSNQWYRNKVVRYDVILFTFCWTKHLFGWSDKRVVNTSVMALLCVGWFCHSRSRKKGNDSCFLYYFVFRKWHNLSMVGNASNILEYMCVKMFQITEWFCRMCHIGRGLLPFLYITLSRALTYRVYIQSVVLRISADLKEHDKNKIKGSCYGR